MKDFLSKWKVFLFGLTGAIVMAVIQVDASNGLQWTDMAMPAILAVSGYIGTQLRGQWNSIIGIAFAVLINIVQAKIAHQPWKFDATTLQWFLAQLAPIIWGLNAPPAKPRSYEHDPVIETAKTTKNE